MFTSRALVTAAIAASAVVGAAATVDAARSGPPVKIDILTPEPGHDVGIEGAGWFIDLEVEYPRRTLEQAGFSGFQLTGPAGHANVPPAPGLFSTGRDDRMPGLVVLVSTTNSDRIGFSGPGTNLANLFNLTGVTDRSDSSVELWDTWLVGADIAGRDVDATLFVAVVDDLDGNGILDDAPNVVADANGDGRVDDRDLKAIGLASKVERVQFHINGDPA